MKRKNDLVWSISLLVISIVSIVLFGSGIIGIELSDTAKRMLGIVDLLALPVLSYTSIKKFKRGKKKPYNQ